MNPAETFIVANLIGLLIGTLIFFFVVRPWLESQCDEGEEDNTKAKAPLLPLQKRK